MGVSPAMATRPLGTQHDSSVRCVAARGALGLQYIEGHDAARLLLFYFHTVHSHYWASARHQLAAMEELGDLSFLVSTVVLVSVCYVLLRHSVGMLRCGRRCGGGLQWHRSGRDGGVRGREEL